MDEEGVDAARETETFAAVALAIDNWRWSGVPFVLRTGKASSRDRRFIAIHFRGVPHLPFEKNDPEQNVLRLEIDADRMSLSVDINGPGDPFVLECVQLQA